MDFKKWKIISPIIIFILCSLTHFGYELIPNVVTSILFPVNESIFEHMKMIYTSILLFSLIEYFVMKKNSWHLFNLGINPLLTGATNIISFLIVYLPIRHIMNENMIVTFIILFISNIIASIVSYHILKSKQMVNDKLGIVLSLLPYIVFIYYTYNPMYNNFFYDPKNELYGIPK